MSQVQSADPIASPAPMRADNTTGTLGLACRSCGRDALKLIMSFGTTPLANALVAEAQLAETEERFPLDLAFCTYCTLTQLTVSVPPEKLFREYLYFSSFSDDMLRHAKSLAGSVIAREQLNANSLVVEVASNDGYLLQYYLAGGVPVLGIEPAVNIAKVAKEQRNIPTISEFFGTELANELVSGGTRADVTHAHNVLAHVPDLNGFVEGFKILLKDNGVAIFETPYVREMVEHAEFDTIYHEHLYYYSLTALKALFERHGLALLDVEKVPIHGVSLRVYVAHKARVEREGVSSRVTDMLRDEAEWGVDRIERYDQFAAGIERLRRDLLATLAQLKKDGKRIVAYGASAKSTTLLNFFGIGRETLDFIVDRSTVKQGYYTPGTQLLISPPERLLAEQPDYVLLLTWNFANEILAQQTDYRQRGGRFIVPLPELRVV